MSTLRVSLIALIGIAAAQRVTAESFHVGEDVSSGRTFFVSAEITGEGTFRFQPPQANKDSPVELPVKVAAGFGYAERRLTGNGRDEAAFRSLREYSRAESEIRVGQEVSTPILRETRRRIVARATREGVAAYATEGPLTANEVELLPQPGDSLLLPALLPNRSVSVGETWTPAPWVAPALAGSEAAFDHKLTCRLQAVRGGVATVTFDGHVEGAAKGASSKTDLAGSLEYDVAAAAITSAKVTHTETRAIGPLSPGMTLALISTIERTQVPADAAISDQTVAAVPVDPPAELLRVEHRAPFHISLTCDRDWRLFHQTSGLLILRLLDRGGLVAQCNAAPGPTVPAGQRTPGKAFGDMIRKSLGEKVTEVVATEELRTNTGLDVYRVTVRGKAEDAERLWRYYLVTAPDGRQAELVFTLEPGHLSRLKDRDLDLVASIEFLSPAEPRAAKK